MRRPKSAILQRRQQLSIGQFVFSLKTAPSKELQRQRNCKHRTSSRVGARDASQYTGAGDDTITLNGMVAQDNEIGTIASLDELAKMGDTGDAYVLVDGSGTVYGAFIIESLNETATYHTAEGIARKIEFNLSIKRVDDDVLSLSSDVKSTTDAGKATASEASTVLSDTKKVANVAAAVVTAAKSSTVSNLSSAVVSVTDGIDASTASAVSKGLSNANGLSLANVVSAAKQISQLNGQTASSAIALVLSKAADAS